MMKISMVYHSSYGHTKVLANTDQGAEFTPPLSDRKTAEYFGRKIVEIAQKFKSKE